MNLSAHDGDWITDSATVICPECERTMATWELERHCCQLLQLIAVPQNNGKVTPVLFAGLSVGEIRSHGNKLAYYMPGEKVPHVVVENPANHHMQE